MKNLIYLLLMFSFAASAAPKSLESEIKDLEVKDAVPNSRLNERYYAVQARATPLAGRTEVLAGVAQNYSGSGFLDATQVSVDGLYHFDDRWALGGGFARVNNKFTASANNLQAVTGYLPDVDYARNRLEARGQVNLFYGKFRLTSKQAMGFDQYLALGPVINDLRSGTTTGLMGDIGFAFYFGKQISVHLGAKDYYYRENRTLTKGYGHNVHGYLQAGVLF